MPRLQAVPGRLAKLTAALICLVFVASQLETAEDHPTIAQTVAPVELIPISTDFNNPIGIDHHSPSGRVVLSVNYPSGQPYNFELVAWDGSREAFSSIAGLTEEIKIATVRESDCTGGFQPGELFTGTGKPGELARIAADGSQIQAPWVQLPDEAGLMRGSMFQDRYCVFDGDLVVSTTAGGIWRIDAAGEASRLADLGVHLEGITTVPDDPVRYGPWAGRILTGAEGQATIHAVDAAGRVESYQLGIQPEDFDIVPPRSNFYGVDFAGKRIMGAPAEAWRDKLGDVVIAQESGQLWLARWEPASERFGVHLLATVGQWEHVTFSTAGLVEIPTPTPEDRATPSAVPTLPSPSASPTPGPIYLPIIQQRICPPRLDLVLVLDMSTSMRRPLPGGRSKLEVVLEAALRFVDSLDLDAGKAGLAIVGFNDRAWIAQPPTTDRAAILAALERLPQAVDQGTRLDLALATGGGLLPEEGLEQSRVLVLLTDGLPNRVPTPEPAGGQAETVLAVAEALRASGIIIYALGVGRPDAPELPDRIDPVLLRGIAGGATRYFEAGDVAGLLDAWRRLSASVTCPERARFLP